MTGRGIATISQRRKKIEFEEERGRKKRKEGRKEAKDEEERLRRAYLATCWPAPLGAGHVEHA